MTRSRRFRTSGAGEAGPSRWGRTAIALIAGGLLVVSCSSGSTTPAAPAEPATTTSTVVAGPMDLGQRTQDLRGGPVAEPIVLRIPAIDVDAEILGVGMTAKDVMDAPSGEPDDAVWRQAFWYRGSAVPGQASTALIAGHVNNQLDDPGVFARLDELQVGDTITVHDTRDGSDVTFTVTSAHSYTLAEAAEPEVLREMYGAGPIDGSWPVAFNDGRAHLTLVTCAGTYVDGTHDHRLVVQAVR